MATAADFKANRSPTKSITYEDYLESAPETKIVEWADNVMITYMPPTHQHQDVIGFLGNLLRTFIEILQLGQLCLAPFEVKLWPKGPAREPDILFVKTANLEKLTSKRFNGGPDLVIEIISPSSISEDRVRKFREYERAEVTEYWLIDPRPHQQQADFYVLDASQTYQPAPVDEAGVYHSQVLAGFWLKLAWLWEEPLPTTLLALAEILQTVEALPPTEKETYQTLYKTLAKKTGRK